MLGEIGILNVGAGDTKLVFDPKNPEDCARAARTVTDMLKRGYVILIEVSKDSQGEPLYRRVKEFKEDTCEYIIAGDVNLTDGKIDEQQGSTAAATEGSAEGRKPRRVGAPPPRRIHASTASGIAVGRTAGG